MTTLKNPVTVVLSRIGLVALGLALVFAPAIRAEEPAASEPVFKVGLNLDAYFSSNLSDPGGGKNALRAFDVMDEQGPQFGLGDLTFDLSRRPVGFRLDLDWGKTAEIVNSFEPSNGDAWEHVQQAFIGANLNRSGTTFIEAGKWVTPFGAEVIEAGDNWLHGRGLLFTWAVPRYHAGIRVTHEFKGGSSITGHANNGWNAVGETGRGPSVGLSFTKVFAPNLRWTTNLMSGEEASMTGTDEMLHLVDFVIGFEPTARWSTSFDVNMAKQDDAHWYGLSAMGRFQFNERDSIAFRGEFLDDDGGRAFGAPMTACSATVGYKATLPLGFAISAEARHDSTDSAIFPNDDGKKFEGHQDTVMVGVTYKFGHAFGQRRN
jgi:hypothetical protein